MTNQTQASNNWAQHISDLAEEDRKAIEEHVKTLPHILRQLELRVECGHLAIDEHGQCENCGASYPPDQDEIKQRIIAARSREKDRPAPVNPAAPSDLHLTDEELRRRFIERFGE